MHQVKSLKSAYRFDYKRNFKIVKLNYKRIFHDKNKKFHPLSLKQLLFILLNRLPIKRNIIIPQNISISIQSVQFIITTVNIMIYETVRSTKNFIRNNPIFFSVITNNKFFKCKITILKIHSLEIYMVFFFFFSFQGFDFISST